MYQSMLKGIHFQRAPPRHRAAAAPQGRLRGEPLPAGRPLPGAGRLAGAARPRGRARNRADRLLRRGRGPRSRRSPPTSSTTTSPASTATPRPRRSTSPSASTSCIRTASTTPRSTPRWVGPTPGSGTCIARCSCRPTESSTRNGSSRPGRSVQAFDTRWGRAAILICEDAWHSFTPMLAALDGAQLILVPSASPARGIGPDGDARRTAHEPRSLEPDHSGHRGRARRLCRAGPAGGVRGRQGLPRRLDRGGSAGRGSWRRGRSSRRRWSRRPLDFEEITRARADLPLLADLEMRLPHLLGSLHHGAAKRGREHGGRTVAAVRRRRAPRERAPRSTKRRPVAPPSSDRDPLDIDPDLTRRWLVEFIRDEVQRRRGFEKVVIGLSGGVDSSLVAYLAAEALGAGERARRADALPHLESRRVWSTRSS